MKNIFLIIAISTIAGSLLAQSKKDLKNNKVKSFKEVETIVENGKEMTHNIIFQRMDGDGNITEEIDYDKDGKVKIEFKKVGGNKRYNIIGLKENMIQERFILIPQY